MNFEEQKPNFSAEQENILGELTRIRNDAYEVSLFNTHEKIAEQCNQWIAQYGRDELSHCALYHLLIGSTMPEDSKAVFDMNDGIIEHFIRTELSPK